MELQEMVEQLIDKVATVASAQRDIEEGSGRAIAALKEGVVDLRRRVESLEADVDDLAGRKERP